MTNGHVANDRPYDIELADGRRLQGWLVARDPKHDLAAIAINVGGLHAAAFRSGHTMRPAEMVIAVGNPMGDVGAVSTGVAHHAVGNLRWLLADIRPVPGNTGGPLSDANGTVIGVNSMVIGELGCP
jgi:serine protease Do